MVGTYLNAEKRAKRMPETTVETALWKFIFGMAAMPIPLLFGDFITDDSLSKFVYKQL